MFSMQAVPVVSSLSPLPIMFHSLLIINEYLQSQYYT
jgi:hypothetical protein